jgi:hypothetical protein
LIEPVHGTVIGWGVQGNDDDTVELDDRHHKTTWAQHETTESAWRNPAAFAKMAFIDPNRPTPLPVEPVEELEWVRYCDDGAVALTWENPTPDPEGLIRIVLSDTVKCQLVETLPGDATSYELDAELVPEDDFLETVIRVANNGGATSTTIVDNDECDDRPAIDAFRRGDVDGSGLVDITDAINNLSFQFIGAFQPPCMDALDFDDSGTIEITDPIGNLSRQFAGGPPAPPPGSATCGEDPTPDPLSCDAYPSC